MDDALSNAPERFRAQANDRDGSRSIDDGSRLLAIDIGRTGALALFVGNDLVEISDMPVLADNPAGRPTINGPLLATLIRQFTLPSASHANSITTAPKPA